MKDVLNKGNIPMADEVAEPRVVRPRRSGMSGLALLLSIIALVIAIMAYNRTGGNLNNRVKTEVQKGLNGTSNTLDRTIQNNP